MALCACSQSDSINAFNNLKRKDPYRNPSGAELVEEPEQIVTRVFAAKFFDALSFKGGLNLSCPFEEGFSCRSEMQGVRATVIGGFAAFGKSARIEAVDQRYEISALYAKDVGDLDLLTARVSGYQHQNGIFCRSKIKVLKKGDEALKDHKLSAA